MRVDMSESPEAAQARKARAQKIMLWSSVGAIVILVVAIAGVSAKVITTLSAKNSSASGSQQIAARPAAFTQATPAATAGPGPCTTVTVLSSLENAEMVDNLAKAYNAQPRDVDGKCVTVAAIKD